MRWTHSSFILVLQVIQILGVHQNANDGGVSSEASPNILIMLADDLGWHDLSWHNPRVNLTNITIDTNTMMIMIINSTETNTMIRWSAPTWLCWLTTESYWSSITGDRFKNPLPGWQLIRRKCLRIEGNLWWVIFIRGCSHIYSVSQNQGFLAPPPPSVSNGQHLAYWLTTPPPPCQLSSAFARRPFCTTIFYVDLFTW